MLPGDSRYGRPAAGSRSRSRPRMALRTPRDLLVSQRIILLTPRRRFIANRFGLGYQLPLGLVFLGGPLVDAGHVVRLIDNDLYGWDTPRVLAEVTRFRPDIVFLGHTGSTAAHPVCMAAARALKHALPHLRIGYGGAGWVGDAVGLRGGESLLHLASFSSETLALSSEKISPAWRA